MKCKSTDFVTELTTGERFQALGLPTYYMGDHSAYDEANNN